MSLSHETSEAAVVPKAPRTRDAVASKESLLQAAQDLFGQRGFERTTIRDIGERAGVDAALIARYFGSKSDLYFAAVAAEDSREEHPRRFEGLSPLADAVVAKADRHGPGPIMQALVRLDASDEIRGAALQRVRRRLIEPLEVHMIEQGVDRPELRAQVAVAAMLGITLSRSLGWFEEMRTVPKDELVELMAQALQEVIGTTFEANDPRDLSEES